MTTTFDIVVVGAGPAGMAAATEAERSGATVCLLDEQADAGGQIYRNVAHSTQAQSQVLGPDYVAGLGLVRDLSASGVEHRKGATVWNLDSEGIVTFSVDGRGAQIRARHIILATGAMERPVPIPGWTTPGAMTVGAAQILMKSAGVAPNDAVLIGSGPLLYLVASQLVAAGAPPKALIETQTSDDMLRAMRHFGLALRGWKELLKGIRMIAGLRRAKVKRFTASTDIRITGRDAVQSVRFRAQGRDHEIATTTALLHQGVVPNTQISRLLGLRHVYDRAQFSFKPVVDPYGQSSDPMVSIAGDGAGIGGAKVAALSGRLATLNALFRIGRIDEATVAEKAKPLVRARRAGLAPRPFLDAAYPPPASVIRPTDDTIICRCEEVSAGDIRRYAALGCNGPNQTKAFGRSGMGPCQGRYCGLTVTELLAEETRQSQDAVGGFRIRAPLKPVTLKELASLSSTNILKEDP